MENKLIFIIIIEDSSNKFINFVFLLHITIYLE